MEEITKEQRDHEVDEAVAAFEHEHAWWDSVLRAIGHDRLDEPGMMGEWPPKDMIAHLSGWQWKTLQSLKHSLNGGDYPPTPWPAEYNDPGDWEEDGDFEPINQWIHQQAANADGLDILEASKEQWKELRDLIGGLTIEQMKDPNLFPRLEGKSMKDALLAGELTGHFREHREADIDPWLDRNGRRF